MPFCLECLAGEATILHLPLELHGSRWKKTVHVVTVAQVAGGLIRLALGYQVCFDIGDCHSTAVLDAESRGAAR